MIMKLLVVGGGGREHTIIKKLKENPEVTEIFALPGNGGISADATCVNIAASDIDGIRDFAALLWRPTIRWCSAVWMRSKARAYRASAPEPMQQ